MPILRFPSPQQSVLHLSQGGECVELLEKPDTFHRNMKWMVDKIHEVCSHTEVPQLNMSCCLGETNVLACIYLRLFCGLSYSSTGDRNNDTF